MLKQWSSFCNTASALALADLQELYNVPIIGMVQPGAIITMNATKNKDIGIIGTNATIKLDSMANI